MEKQFRIVRIAIFCFGAIFFTVGAVIAYKTFTGPAAGKTDSDYIMPLVFMGIGLLDVIMISVWSAIVSRKAKKEKWLLENGQCIKATFTSVNINKSISVNNAHPYKIVAEWQDPLDGVLHTFKSGNIWFNPEHFIDQSKKISVYCDPADYKRYSMDTSFLPATK